MMGTNMIGLAKEPACDHIQRMRCFSFLSIVSLAVLPAFAAQAASSDWHHIEGGAIRIITSGAPDAAGKLRGALEIRLKPGWKTYWRDPGASGVPPTLEIMAGTHSASVALDFPAPERFDDGYATWAGYDQPIALALTLAMPVDRPVTTRLETNIFLGVCETICIPVSTTLTLTPGSAGNNPQHASIVEAAFAALPQAARPGFSAKLAGKESDALLIEAEVPDGTTIVDLFVAGTQTLTLDTPQRTQNGSQMLFRVPMIAAQTDTNGEELTYTLVTDDGAVSGHIMLP